MEYKIAVLAGDGIGPEVIGEGLKLLEAVGARYGHRFHCQAATVGGAAIDLTGRAIDLATLELCAGGDAVLFGAVGGPKWDDPKARVRPEDAILALRKELKLYANLRPVKVHTPLQDASPIKAERLKGVDLVVVRELTGGLYFGKPKKRWQTSRGWRAVDTLAYSQPEVDRILRVGFQLAQGRRKKLTSVDKANILETGRLWRQRAQELAAEFPDVALEHMLVDTAAMQLMREPARFDVVVTENTFGDILTDEVAVLAGSMGMLPSASLGARSLPGVQGGPKRLFGLYEPIHGSAPDIAGQNKANPLATFLSLALLLRYSCGLEAEAAVVEQVVEELLRAGYRTGDIAAPDSKVVGTREMGDLAVRALRSLKAEPSPHAPRD